VLSESHTKMQRPIFLILLLFASIGCSSDQNDSLVTSDYEHTVILISADGLRADYLDKIDTPNIDRLIAGGVWADKGMKPVYPCFTFPNHYSIVTGLYPAHHGIVSNTMFDPEMNARFRITDREAITNSAWWGGEPLWVTAENAGVKSATYYWVGSEAPVKGVSPSYWYTFDDTVPAFDRIDQLFTWLELPEAERPGFLSVYFSDVDHEGHTFGPDAPETVEAVKAIDSYIGRLLTGLDERGLTDAVNIILVSDHGMTQLSRDRVIPLDDYIDLDDVYITDAYSVLGLNPKEGQFDKVYNALKDAHPNMHVFKAGEAPARFHYEGNERIPQIFGHVDDGWLIVRERGFFEQNEKAAIGGAHGYDNELESMRATFVAHGPAFKQGVTVEPFENIQLYNVMAGILGVEPAPNDGTPGALSSILNN
jgi:predicted AlkP superfamily pyrophosphatase or phosphodiesterase